MESQPSTSTTTSTTVTQDNMPSSQSASVDKTPTSSNTDPTLSIPNPTYSPLIQEHVTNAAIICSTLGEETPSTTTSNPTEGSTSHAECRRTNRRATVNKTSCSMMKNKVEQSLPNQAKTLFVTCWHSRRPSQNSTDPV